ncbi:hypothetical protein GOV06_00205 [Candidatus Woesearchaeota archaeon]|nr:hypothetical protein [Candidatus Woesearchaeota archaeon]
MAVLTDMKIGRDGKVWIHIVKGKYNDRRLKLSFDKFAKVVIKSYKPVVLDDDYLEGYEDYMD